MQVCCWIVGLTSVVDPGGRGGHAPPGPVKTSHKKDGH